MRVLYCCLIPDKMSSDSRSEEGGKSRNPRSHTSPGSSRQPELQPVVCIAEMLSGAGGLLGQRQDSPGEGSGD